MPAAEFRQSVTIPAVPGQVREARVFVARVLGESHAHVDLALLLASELVTNSVRHSGSAVPGGVVTVTVAAGDEAVRVEVTDRIGDGVPVLPPAAFADADAVGGGWVSSTNSPHDGATAGRRVHDDVVRAFRGGFVRKF